MSQTEKSNKRIVSRTVYIALMGKKGSLTLIGCVLLALSILLGLSSFFMFIYVVAMVALGFTYRPWYAAFLLLVALGLGALVALTIYLVGKYGWKMLDSATEITPVLFTSRTKINELSASESLVRASSEPVQEQQSVLLRASLQSQQTPAEQLLRPMEE